MYNTGHSKIADNEIMILLIGILARLPTPNHTKNKEGYITKPL